MRSSITATLAVAALAIAFARGAGAAPSDVPDDKILPPSQHSSDKARHLAERHAAAMRSLNRDIYFCMPWLEVNKNGIGFFKPRGATDDKRYMTLNVYIDQQPSREFSNLTLEQRADAMFSRYVGPLLKRMTQNPAVKDDEAIDGFTVILVWLKEVPKRDMRPVNETIAAFIERADAEEFIAGHATSGDLAQRARVLAWDGETPRGSLKLAAWDDDFVLTYKVKGYAPPAGVTCR